jgi:hypothetical protein
MEMVAAVSISRHVARSVQLGCLSAPVRGRICVQHALRCVGEAVAPPTAQTA